jgi:argininosuccinate lyase
MPQKKNPDVAELVRGKTGRVYGSLMTLLTLMKSLPLAYNKDMQEDKEGLFDSCDTLLTTLAIFTGMLRTIKFIPEKMLSALDRGYLLATDIADYLVSKGAAFRNAHEIVGKLVNWAATQGKTFSEISLQEYKKFSRLFEDDVFLITIDRSLAARNSPGGTSAEQVNKALQSARELLKSTGK